ncbi:ferritin-like protein [Solirubrobacter ginsenosidimutans]|uniref:Ferritin-like protein n=1 Tax=Solirubrobacter ginsenosidimutans TaxID=490573 RepID=A0A9X3MQW2_9ACTN|nr:ferritin-like protein [Solirubrobacter ginsenosidimutans]MDA0160132.1 ferritin-like protein [Solirubrobacter ginsenosidimutans]
MASPRITTVEELQRYLYAAMQLEHATIPPYLTALYSIHPGTNSDAFHVLRVVAVEEMLHLTLVANVLNAIGGTPDLTAPDFIPVYPAYLPDGEVDFAVSRERFCRDSLDTFLKIERPREAPDEESRLVHRQHRGTKLITAAIGAEDMRFYSIGEFYREIERGLRFLEKEKTAAGEELFVGDPARQILPQYYYSGGGEVVPVTDLHSACAALRLIAEQGEGVGGRIYDVERELAHYYRFKQLLHGRYYQDGDEPDDPTGPPLDVEWDAVYPLKKNASLADYPEGSELHTAALAFNAAYADFLELLTRAYTGSPELLIEGVADMFRLRERMTALMHNPIPGQDGVNASPTFELAPVAVGS